MGKDKEKARLISLCTMRALQRLKKAHYAEYLTYYEEEQMKVGIEVNSNMKEVQRENEILRKRIQELESRVTV